ncbi:MAG: 50S ribosomal protein L25 [Ilumatobacteraceae bacterium]
MSSNVLIAETGRQTGSPSSRRLRREDRIPAVVYGLGMTPISVSVDRRDLRAALSGPSGVNTVLDLTVDGTVYPAIVKEMQRHPVRRSVSHIDFLQVNLDVEITVSVPVVLLGEAKEVAMNNGLVDLQMAEIQVTTTPRTIPDSIEIDISEMTVDDVITVGQLPVPAGCVFAHEEDQPVVTVTILRTAAEEEEEASEEEGEGEEGEGEEGEGSGDDASSDDAPADDAE